MKFFGDPDGDYSNAPTAEPERPTLETVGEFARRLCERGKLHGDAAIDTTTQIAEERDEQIAMWLDAYAAWFTANDCDHEAAVAAILAKRIRGAK